MVQHRIPVRQAGFGNQPLRYLPDAVLRAGEPDRDVGLAFAQSGEKSGEEFSVGQLDQRRGVAVVEAAMIVRQQKALL